MQYFGTDGIRASVNQFPLNPQGCEFIALGLIQYLRVNQLVDSYRICIARDTRVSGIAIQEIIKSILEKAKLNITVDLLGVLPTPALALITQQQNYDVGIMITASHNPATDNGIKFFAKTGYKLNKEAESIIENIIHQESLKKHLNDELFKEVSYHSKPEDNHSAQTYTKHLVDLYPVLAALTNKLKIILDTAHGSNYDIAAKVFTQLGFDITTLFNQPDGLNINHDCGATHAQALAQEVLKQKADIGIAFDGDGDRVIFCDETGQVVHGDKVIGTIGLLLARLAHKHSAHKQPKQGLSNQQTVVTTKMCNTGLKQQFKAQNIAVELTDIGDKYVMERLREINGVFGGENSGHLIFMDKGFTGDGILGALEMLSLWQEFSPEQTFSELVNQIQLYPQHLENIKLISKPPLDELSHLQQVLQKIRAEWGDQGSDLIRYSGTENLIRILLEHQDESQIYEKLELIKQALVKDGVCQG